MNNKCTLLCIAVLLPLGLSSVAVAQTASPQQSAPQQGDMDAYSLKGSALKAPSASAQSLTTATYELSGTSISGATTNAGSILTAPVSAGAGAYKTESGVYFYPTVSSRLGYNDNVKAAASNTIGSSFVNVTPQVVAELKNKGDRYTLLASLNATRYTSSTSENTTNSEFVVAGDNYFTGRARAGWAVGQISGTDARGATNFGAASNEPDRWHTTNLDGRFIYGAAEAQGRVEFDLGHQSKTYDNNRIVMATADFDLSSFAARGFYRLGSRTQALLEFRDAKANYTSSLSTDSNTERRYYAGLTWEATAATTAIVKIGQMTKDFDSGKEGFSGGSWEASVRWLPQTYSVFDLQASRAAVDPTGLGSYNLNTNTNLSWSYKWSQVLSSRLAMGVLNSEFVGTIPARTDTTNSYGLSVDYALRRWLKVGFNLASADKNSSDAASAYKQNVYMLTLNASL